MPRLTMFYIQTFYRSSCLHSCPASPASQPIWLLVNSCFITMSAWWMRSMSKLLKSITSSRVMITNVLPSFYGSQCSCYCRDRGTLCILCTVALLKPWSTSQLTLITKECRRKYICMVAFDYLYWTDMLLYIYIYITTYPFNRGSQTQPYKIN